MNKKYLLFLLILVFVISGCATRTRIGMLIPTHHLSNERSGEEVWLHVTKISTANLEMLRSACEIEPEQMTPFVFPGVTALASMAIGMAVDYLKAELQEEAKSYEASYGAKAWLTTKDLQGIISQDNIRTACNLKLSELEIEFKGINEEIKKIKIGEEIKKIKDGIATLNKEDVATILEAASKSGSTPDPIKTNGKDVVILISRWVDESAFRSPPPNQEEYNKVIGLIEKLTEKSDYIIPAEGSTKSFKEGEFKEEIKGKKLAFAYALSLHLADSGLSNSPFLVKPIWKWQWLSKAKVVSFNPVMPLSLPANIFLQTGSELDYNIRLSIDFLASGKTKVNDNEYMVPQMLSLGLKDPIMGPAKHDLSGSKQLTEYKNPPIIGWMAIPGYPGSNNTGYFSLQLTVNESDPSNVKKTILKGSDYLEANRDNIINSLNPLK